MYTLCFHIFMWTALLATAQAFPWETISDGLPLVPATATSAPPIVTGAALLRCTDGSTVLHTTDCTVGTPVAYCYKPKPPMKCEAGFFPSVWHPDHCMEEQTCFPIDADWITTECSNGAFPFTTTTLYEGILADGVWTAVSGKGTPVEHR